VLVDEDEVSQSASGRKTAPDVYSVPELVAKQVQPRPLNTVERRGITVSGEAIRNIREQ
jgi:hypothetical protein